MNLCEPNSRIVSSTKPLQMVKLIVSLVTNAWARSTLSHAEVVMTRPTLQVFFFEKK